MAQVVEYLPSKPEAQRSIPTTGKEGEKEGRKGRKERGRKERRKDVCRDIK
jgi:hypothetical protein